MSSHSILPEEVNERLSGMMLQVEKYRSENHALKIENAEVKAKLTDVKKQLSITRKYINKILESESIDAVCNRTKNSVLAEIPLPQTERLKRIKNIEIYNKSKHGEPLEYFLEHYKEAQVFQSDIQSHDPKFLIVLRNRFRTSKNELSRLVPKYSDYLSKLVDSNTARGVDLKTLPGLVGSYNRKFN